MDNEEWITSPEVIDIIVQLGGLRAGDEIIFQHDLSRAHSLVDGMVAVVTQDPKHMHKVGERAHWGSQVGSIAGTLRPLNGAAQSFFTRENIRAWRRPLTRKEEQKS